MKKKLISKSGLFTFRVLLTFTLCSAAVFFALLSFGGTPRSAKLSKRSTLASRAQTSGEQTTSPDLAPSTPTGPGIPRYYNYAPGPGVGEAAGEPSIGFNPANGKVMYLAGLQTLQVTLPEKIAPLGSVPKACDATWTDVSFTGTRVRSADPIMFTDQGTGRTFVSQLNTVTQTSPVLIGLNSLMAYTDDDGASWTPAQINPPDGSNDHETVGAGPYPAALSSLGNSVNKGHAVYYCGQGGYVLALTSIAYCSRSDDGGLTFNKSIPAYTDAASGCSQAIHGHVKVAPDGTVYLPNAQCGGGQAVAVSTDAGTTWTVHTVPGSASPSGATDIIDPSVAVSKDAPIAPATSNTMYFAYAGAVGSDNRMFVTVTKDRGATWSTPVDVGASLGIKNVVFPAAVAGDSNRAAVAFLGTTTSGDHQAANFTGTWYGFVAHTYDGGVTWTTVNATPAGPVQRNSCIWNGGGNNPCRNLLDFTDATMDDKGMVLFGFADGCVNECETGGPNSYASKATIARQSGGKGLLAQFDPLEPTFPQRACLTACRDDKASYLTWIAPDDGGSDIAGYNIYRSDATHTETLVGQQINPAQDTFTDRNIDPTVTSYSYRITAVNGLGEGPASNSVSVPVGVCLTTGGSCVLPGITEIVDPAGDETDAQPAHDITSTSMAEPITNSVSGAASNIVVTIKVATFKDTAGNFTIPPGWRWSIRFGVIKNGVLLTAPPSGIPGDTSVTDYFVGMVSDGQGAPAGSGNPSFTWGVTSTPNNAARLFTTKGNIDPSSSATVDGTITLVLPKSIIQNPGPGDTISITLASVRLGSPSGGTNDTIPDITGPGTYVLRTDNLCLPNNPPLAALTANVDQGVVPLQVNFDASASSDPDAIDHIASYTFNFNDGNNDVTQASPTISHTFSQTGEYTVRLVVTDSRGKQSSNTATFSVDVIPPLSTIASRKVHGTAGPFDVPLPINGTAGIECRAPDSNNGYQLIFTFARNITAAGNATKGNGNATVGTATIGPDPNQVTVPITDVANAQHLIINLDGVHDASGAILSNMSARMDVLEGDVDASGRVDSSDVFQVRQQTLQNANINNFRLDVDESGRIDSTDIFTVRQHTLTSLP
jgi:PKD repeat protein